MSLRKSSRLKQVQGTYRSPRKPVALAVRAGRPKVPANLSEQARAYWPKWVEAAETAGTLARCHGRALAEVCELSALIDKLRADVAKRHTFRTKNVAGEMKLVANPAANLLLRNQRMLRDYLIEFGLTPRSIGQVEQAHEPLSPTNGAASKKEGSHRWSGERDPLDPDGRPYFT